MKAHDLAKSLNTLARMLRAGPNVELEEIGNLSTHTSKGVDRSPKKNAEGRSGAIALLAAMSNLKKAEVLQMADDLAIPI